ncbi:hypothetical protein FVEN_g12727 [Fusarium venenatum]|uniref:RBR-type E3 ubiquitin transferase n=1 Tax=Fusarium venenatum TaxID=56646 RepID=A0A2L2TH60_9HYPO|nr:uncharacterized protein FVRRES_13583 [Fusarium venenatum]KAG8358407.1 hypothetical protein FVEN_g12727 [Fusarium venenatum]CEI41448.1 unnamed protein product [Fusarium venenatum]
MDDRGILRLRRSARVLGKRSRTEFENDGTAPSPTLSVDRTPTLPIDPTPSSPSVRQATRTIRTGECLACGEDFPRSTMLSAPCTHLFCKPCAGRLVSVAMNSESFFPARCCENTISVTLRNHFSKEVVAQYEAKRIEFEIPRLERVYCSSPPCAAFIPPAQIISGVAHCTHCLTNTCVACKKKAHNGFCRKLGEEDLQSVLQLAESTGWKRCGKCGHLIEKSAGCNHMICLCGHDFCYNCGKDIRGCVCHRMPPPGVIAQPMTEEERIAIEGWDGYDDWGELEDETPCNHRWTRLLEPSNCQECGKTVQGYNIFVCRACQLVACLACRREL